MEKIFKIWITFNFCENGGILMKILILTDQTTFYVGRTLLIVTDSMDDAWPSFMLKTWLRRKLTPESFPYNKLHYFTFSTRV